LSRRLRSASRDVGHTWLSATERCQTLASLDANKRLHRDPEEVGFIHVRVGKLERALVKGVVDRYGGSHLDSKLMPGCINYSISLDADIAIRARIFIRP
jgi:hypothetical protein